MQLLHLSDIHFRKAWCLRPNLDRDRAVRTRLVGSIGEQVTKFGPVDAILVTGDLAFAGDPFEYQFATDWLINDVAPAARCDSSQIFTVPGNHDVDRDMIEEDQAIRNVLDAIRHASDHRRNSVLVDQINHEDTARSLLKPLTAYNDFATRFGCQVYAPEQIYWKQELKLNAGVILRLHGLTSTLISGAVRDDGSQDDKERELYLSPLQTEVIDPAPNVVNLVMSHHPPSWFSDHDGIQTILPDRAALQIFGHRHQQRVQREKYFMRFDAGALHPNRQERGWRPCYNLIRLKVVGDGTERLLDIEATQMEWQVNPEQFSPRKDGDKDVYHHQISIPGNATSAGATAAMAVGGSHVAAVAIQTVAHIQAAASAAATVTTVMSQRSSRNLMMRFWDLSSSRRYQIALELGLITPEEVTIPEPERYSRAFRRAVERGMFERLDEEVTKWQKK